MMNQFFGVGRLVAQPEVKESENVKKYTNFTIAVQRSYKNADGVYETDFLDVVSFGPMAETTCEYCQKGDMIGVEGRLQVSSYTDKDGNNKTSYDVLTDKIDFLNLKKENKKEQTKSVQSINQDEIVIDDSMLPF